MCATSLGAARWRCRFMITVDPAVAQKASITLALPLAFHATNSNKFLPGRIVTALDCMLLQSLSMDAPVKVTPPFSATLLCDAYT